MTDGPILLIEDNPLNMELAGEILRQAGLTVLEAVTARERLRLAVEARPALVLLDIQLPDLDGLEAVRRLRADPRTAGIPVVALTAQAMKGDEGAARAAGCDGYIAKPIDTRRFAADVLAYLQAPGGRGDVARP